MMIKQLLDTLVNGKFDELVNYRLGWTAIRMSIIDDLMKDFFWDLIYKVGNAVNEHSNIIKIVKERNYLNEVLGIKGYG